MAKRNIEVLLTKNVFKLGLMGDVVRVKPGYARNFLFPSAAAVPVDQAAKRQIEILRERAAQHLAEQKEIAAAQAKRITGTAIEIAANVSHSRRLFGSVGTRDIVAALAAKNITVENNQVSLAESIKEVGSYDVRLDLFDGVEAMIKLTVTNANPDADLDEILAEPTEEAEEAVEAAAE